MSTSDSAPNPALLALANKLFDLARQGDTTALEPYLRAGAPADLTNDNGDSLIMLASYHGHADTVRSLLRHQADPNRVNDKGQTPLAAAIFKEHDEIIEALLEAGASPLLGKPNALDCARLFGRENWEARLQEQTPRH